jgi:hypothetical protein
MLHSSRYIIQIYMYIYYNTLQRKYLWFVDVHRSQVLTDRSVGLKFMKLKVLTVRYGFINILKPQNIIYTKRVPFFHNHLSIHFFLVACACDIAN